MKYCLSSRQNDAYLKQADEIKVKNRDIKSVPDLLEKYPEATVILEEDLIGSEFDWKELNTYNKLSQGRLILCLGDIDTAAAAKEAGIPFYMGYPVKTFYELNGIKNLGVCYVRVDAPLFFEIDKVKSFEIPVRICANVAYSDRLPREDGVCGLWIRPEDVEKYEPYVDAIEFSDCDINKEQALFRIYALEHKWPGEMSMIITNFNYPGLNRMVLPDVVDKRLNCGQRCQSGGACRVCYRAFDLANRDKLREYVDSSDLS